MLDFLIKFFVFGVKSCCSSVKPKPDLLVVSESNLSPKKRLYRDLEKK